MRYTEKQIVVDFADYVSANKPNGAMDVKNLISDCFRREDDPFYVSYAIEHFLKSLDWDLVYSEYLEKNHD